jgi:hypothetical protein
MSTASAFRINTPQVAGEVIDGEGVLIHFESGCYYSTDKLGAAILELVARQAPVRQIADSLTAAYAAEPGRIESALQRFLGELQQEQLIVPVAAPAGANGAAAGPPPAAGPKLPFEAPSLHKYNDLQDLLLLDPIHETDGAGWPVAKPDATPPGV